MTWWKWDLQLKLICLSKSLSEKWRLEICETRTRQRPDRDKVLEIIDQFEMEQTKNCIRNLYRKISTLFPTIDMELGWRGEIRYLATSTERSMTSKYLALRRLYDAMSNSRLDWATRRRAWSSASSRESDSDVSSNGRNSCWITRSLWSSGFDGY